MSASLRRADGTGAGATGILPMGHALNMAQNTVIVACSDGRIRQIEGSKERQSLATDPSNGTSVAAAVAGVTSDAVAQLCVTSAPHCFLYAGTVGGNVMAYEMPLGGLNQGTARNALGSVAPAYVVRAHSAAVTRMCVSFDDNYLFTVAEDGCLCIFEVTCCCIVSVLLQLDQLIL